MITITEYRNLQRRIRTDNYNTMSGGIRSMKSITGIASLDRLTCRVLKPIYSSTTIPITWNDGASGSFKHGTPASTEFRIECKWRGETPKLDWDWHGGDGHSIGLISNLSTQWLHEKSKDLLQLWLHWITVPQAIVPFRDSCPLSSERKTCSKSILAHLRYTD